MALRTTMFTFLMVNEGTASSANWTKVADIKDYPDIIPAPSGVEFTSLSNTARVYRPGLADTPDNFPFTCNYDRAVVARCKALEGSEKEYAVWFGGTPGATVNDAPTPTGADGRVEFNGQLTVALPGKGVNDPHEFTVNIMPSTEPRLVTDGTTL